MIKCQRCLFHILGAVIELAQRLISHGVDVVLDKWELKEGQDKYAFMERCVNDPDITKVCITNYVV